MYGFIKSFLSGNLVKVFKRSCGFLSGFFRVSFRVSFRVFYDGFLIRNSYQDSQSFMWVSLGLL